MKRGSPSGWITTFIGRRVWPLDPHPDDVHLLDIAHALSNLCRFTGHVRRFYSVAEHCVRVSFAAPPADAFWGLLHDAGEAYLLDLARPVKRLPELEVYRQAEARWEAAIAEHFGLTMPIPPSIKAADSILLRTEQRDLTLAPEWKDFPVLPSTIRPWTSRDAFERFLHRFEVFAPDHPDLADAKAFLVELRGEDLR